MRYRDELAASVVPIGIVVLVTSGAACGGSGDSSAAAGGGGASGPAGPPSVVATPPGLEASGSGEVVLAADGGGALLEARLRSHTPSGSDSQTSRFDFLRKTNASGKVVWAHAVDVTGQQTLDVAGLAVDADDSVYVVATVVGTPALDGEALAGRTDAPTSFLLAFTKDGARRWTKRIDQTVSDGLRAVGDRVWVATSEAVIGYDANGNETGRIAVSLPSSTYVVVGWQIDGDHRVCYGRASRSDSAVVCQNDRTKGAADPAQDWTLDLNGRECETRLVRVEAGAKVLAHVKGCTLGSGETLSGFVRIGAAGEVETKILLPATSFATAGDTLFDVSQDGESSDLSAWRIPPDASLSPPLWAEARDAKRALWGFDVQDPSRRRRRWPLDALRWADERPDPATTVDRALGRSRRRYCAHVRLPGGGIPRTPLGAIRSRASRIARRRSRPARPRPSGRRGARRAKPRRGVLPPHRVERAIGSPRLVERRRLRPAGAALSGDEARHRRAGLPSRHQVSITSGRSFPVVP